MNYPVPGPGARARPIAFTSDEGKNQALAGVNSRNLHQTGGEETGSETLGAPDTGPQHRANDARAEDGSGGQE